MLYSVTHLLAMMSFFQFNAIKVNENAPIFVQRATSCKQLNNIIIELVANNAISSW